MKKQTIKLKESQLCNIINESIKNVLNENSGQALKSEVFSIIENSLIEAFGQDSINANEDVITVTIPNTNGAEYISIKLGFGCTY